MKVLKLIAAASVIALGATSLQASASTYSSIDSQPGGNHAGITPSIDSQPGGNRASVDYAGVFLPNGTDDRGLDTSPSAQ